MVSWPLSCSAGSECPTASAPVIASRSAVAFASLAFSSAAIVAFLALSTASALAFSTSTCWAHSARLATLTALACSRSAAVKSLQALPWFALRAAVTVDPRHQPQRTPWWEGPPAGVFG